MFFLPLLHGLLSGSLASCLILVTDLQVFQVDKLERQTSAGSFNLGLG